MLLRNQTAYLIIIEELLIGLNDPLSIYCNMLDTIHADDLGVAVWITAVIDEPRKASLQSPWQPVCIRHACKGTPMQSSGTDEGSTKRNQQQIQQQLSMHETENVKASRHANSVGRR